MDSQGRKQQAIQNLQQLARLASLSLSMENKLSVVFGKLTEETWGRIIKNTPTWHELYFMPLDQLYERLEMNPSFKEAFGTELGDSNPLDAIDTHIDRAVQVSSEAVSIGSRLAAKPGKVDFAYEDHEIAQAHEDLVLLKVMLAETRARAFYGQGISALIKAGMNGNDEGFYRAVTIDPTIQWHPILIERMSRDNLVGQTEFADKLQSFAKKGPSKNIDPDLHQLRFMLGYFRELGILSKLSNAMRYELFFEQLKLYPDPGSKEGKNVKAALCTFINRWEQSLIA